MEILIDPNGTIRMLYADDLAGLLAEGKARIKRASHVEPTPDGQWTADMSPVGGPVLGPFESRKAGLAAEVAWLKEHGIPEPK